MNMNPPRPAEHGVVPVRADSHTRCMEQLQLGYVAAVAATAGCQIEVHRVDDLLCDVEFVRKSEANSLLEISVRAQLKCTTQVRPDPEEETFPYRFSDRRHFDRLAVVRGINPKMILLVMATHPRQELWTAAGHDSLEMLHCCYWVSLEGVSVAASIQQPTIRVPTRQIFDADALAGILKRLDHGEALRD